MKKFVIPIVIIVLIALGVYWLQSVPEKPGLYDELASCIAESGAIFYGAFWCPVCQSQKGQFGKAAQYLTYVECSTPDGRGQLAVCSEKNISQYPTWELSGGERLEGLVSVEDLAQKTGCPLPTE